MPVPPSTRKHLDDHLGQAEFALNVALNFDCLKGTPAHDHVRAALAQVAGGTDLGAGETARGNDGNETVSAAVGAETAAYAEGTDGLSLAMSARAPGVIVTGGRRYSDVDDFAFLERTMRALGAKEIHTDGTDGVAARVEAQRSCTVCQWRHGELDARRPRYPTERNTTLPDSHARSSRFPAMPRLRI